MKNLYRNSLALRELIFPKIVLTVLTLLSVSFASVAYGNHAFEECNDEAFAMYDEGVAAAEQALETAGFTPQAYTTYNTALRRLGIELDIDLEACEPLDTDTTDGDDVMDDADFDCNCDADDAGDAGEDDFLEDC